MSQQQPNPGWQPERPFGGPPSDPSVPGQNFPQYSPPPGTPIQPDAQPQPYGQGLTQPQTYGQPQSYGQSQPQTYGHPQSPAYGQGQPAAYGQPGQPAQQYQPVAYNQPGGRFPVQTMGRPIGRPQDTTVLLLLMLITFGIYGLIYFYRAYRDLQLFTGHGVGGGLGLVLALFTPATGFLLPHEIKRAYQTTGRPSPVGAWHGLLVVPGAYLLVLPFVWWYQVNGALNDLWRSQGAAG